MIFCYSKQKNFAGVLGASMPDQEYVYLVDVREVVDHMRDKCYHDLGEAFESIFHMFYEIDESGKVRLLEDE